MPRSGTNGKVKIELSIILTFSLTNIHYFGILKMEK